MAEVFAGFDLLLARDVAVKILRPEVARRPGARRRLLVEARITAALRHENVVEIYDAYADDETAWLVSERARCSLRDVLPGSASLGMGLDPSLALVIATHVLRALVVAHRKGVVHRDIKPDNILLASDGRVLLTDFGAAQKAHDGGGGVMGSPCYMSPEQARGENLDGRSDLFALGCVLFRLMTGERLFSSDTHIQLLEQVDSGAARIQSARQLSVAAKTMLLRAVAVNAEDRFGDAQEMLRCCEQQLGAAHVGAHERIAALSSIVRHTPSPSIPRPSSRTATAPQLRARAVLSCAIGTALFVTAATLGTMSEPSWSELASTSDGEQLGAAPSVVAPRPTPGELRTAEETTTLVSTVGLASEASTRARAAPARNARRRKRHSTGVLHVGVAGWAEIWINGVRRGIAPELSRFTLAVGSHQLLATAPGCVSDTHTINIARGSTTRVRVSPRCEKAP